VREKPSDEEEGERGGAGGTSAIRATLARARRRRPFSLAREAVRAGRRLFERLPPLLLRSLSFSLRQKCCTTALSDGSSRTLPSSAPREGLCVARSSFSLFLDVPPPSTGRSLAFHRALAAAGTRIASLTSTRRPS
jgi:hypothetical protein